MSFMMSMTPGIPSSSSSSSPSPPSSPPLSSPPVSLPVSTIPGGYGWPLLGPISDRLDYFWFQGPETFFKKRTEKYKSTVFRTNVPPSFPLFLNVNPNVVAVLDCKSFSYLFDMDLVEKKNILVGDFMPSVNFTGGLRTCAYLDTSEPQHAKVCSYMNSCGYFFVFENVQIRKCSFPNIVSSSTNILYYYIIINLELICLNAWLKFTGKKTLLVRTYRFGFIYWSVGLPVY